jgi:septal ring factor EnvC (AmiA/AmiB activator)
MSENLAKMCRRLSRYAHAQLSATDLERIASRIERLEAELIIAEQRGYANAMEAERKLHEERIEELEAKLAKAVEELQRLGFDFESVVGREIMGVGE